jgi:hypothetical protein
MSQDTVAASPQLENRESVGFLKSGGDTPAESAIYALAAIVKAADQQLHSGSWDDLKHDQDKISGLVSAARLIAENLAHRIGNCPP